MCDVFATDREIHARVGNGEHLQKQKVNQSDVDTGGLSLRTPPPPPPNLNHGHHVNEIGANVDDDPGWLAYRLTMKRLVGNRINTQKPILPIILAIMTTSAVSPLRASRKLRGFSTSNVVRTTSACM